jgi:hypothetical protein
VIKTDGEEYNEPSMKCSTERSSVTLSPVQKRIVGKKTSREKVENEIKGHIGCERAVIGFYGKKNVRSRSN